MYTNQIVPESSNGASKHRATVPMTKPIAPSPHRLESNTGGIDLTDLNFKKFKTGVRQNKYAYHTDLLITSTTYRIASCLAVVIALFLTDFTRALLSKDLDYPVEILMVVVFFFLLSDLILQSLTYPKYLFSFFFWLDFVGTLTLLADMDLALSLVGSSYSDLTVARGGRAGRAARTAGSLRISRIVMWARVARLMRIARVLRFLKDENQQKVKREEKRVMRALTLQENDIDFDHEEIDLLDDDQNEIERNESMKNHKSRSDRNSQMSVMSDCDLSEGMARERVFRQSHSSKIGLTVAD
eukprot:312360_1